MNEAVPFAYICPVCKQGSPEPFRCGGPHPRIGLKRLYYDFVDAVPVFVAEQFPGRTNGPEGPLVQSSEVTAVSIASLDHRHQWHPSFPV